MDGARAGARLLVGKIGSLQLFAMQPLQVVEQGMAVPASCWVSELQVLIDQKEGSKMQFVTTSVLAVE